MTITNTTEKEMDAFEAYQASKHCENCSHSVHNNGPCKCEKVCDFYSTYS